MNLLASNAPRHALCVDDEPDNLRVLSYVLKYHGYEFTAVQSGTEALNLLLNATFDFALIDIQMPFVSGWNIAEKVRSSENLSLRHLPLIALTALAMTGDRERILKAGFDGYISKPIDVLTFRQSVEAILAVSSDRVNQVRKS